MFNHVSPCGYLLPNVYLVMTDIANPDLFVCVCRTWISLDINRFYEEQRQPSSESASRDAKHTQHIEITHPNNVNLKLASHKVASFCPHYLTITPQIYHHPVHRFRSWPHCLDKTKQSHTKSRQNNLHSVHAGPCRIYEQSGRNKKTTKHYTWQLTQRFWVLP